MILMPRRMSSERLDLRPPTAGDAPAIHAFASDPAVTRLLDWPTHVDIDDSRAFLDDVDCGWHAGDDFCWVMVLRRAGAVVGTVGCQFDAHGAEFGYALARSHWRRGLATEAAARVLEAARAIDDVYRFWASCDVDNVGSIRVLEKLGMTCEGRLRRWSERPNVAADGVPRDVYVYAAVR